MSSKNEEVPKEQEQKAQLLDGRLYGLPEGWLVEQRRRTNPRYEGKVDQFFYQPHTRKQFRSLKAAMESIGTEAFEATNVDSHSQASSSKPSRRSSDQKTTQSPVFNFADPPKSVTWVLTDSERDEWTPHIQGAEVPDQVKRFWEHTFDKCCQENNPINNQ
ncbi:PREDICTED: methyl-CpG-binding domain-containing protein 7-like [Fragaria vesca subsp. vesca]